MGTLNYRYCIFTAFYNHYSYFCFAKLVEVSGIEPLTSCMPCKRSPS
jgi:hypothetical protein